MGLPAHGNEIVFFNAWLCRSFRIFKDVWTLTQSAAIASMRATNLATHP
jgi:hypothetical protein